LALEQEALAQLDIPYFAAPANDNALPLSAQQKIEQFFSQPSFNRVMDRLGRLNKADLAWQVDIIRASAYARLTADPHQTGLEDEDKSFHPSSLTRSIQPSALVQQAVKIAQELQERAISPANGRVAAWLGLDYLPELQRYQLQPLRYDFYSGNGGIALFLAALAQVSGDTQFERQALSALQLIRQALPQLASIRPGSDADKIIKATYLGGAVGFGSLLYVLVRVSQLLADSALLAEAGQVAALITPELIAADTKFDVMLGASGAILGLLTLYQATTDPAVLAQAVTCGRHLLAKRVASPTGHQVWPTLHGKFLSGFAHGAAGIAYALLRLHQTLQGTMMAEDGISDPSSFLTAAEEAMNYERSLFSVEAGNWPDLRKPTEMPAFATGWCHGASGIGLARLGAWEMLNTPLICQDIEAALYLTQQAGLADVDHLCCGNFGRLELLLVASRCLSRPELEDMARQQAAWLVNRANQTGSFQLFPSQAQVIYQPGFFQGTAGIGYQLLRLAQPDLLPSALLWA
jgi:type 2 lantibiotic biosynthesis protein LanM